VYTDRTECVWTLGVLSDSGNSFAYAASDSLAALIKCFGLKKLKMEFGQAVILVLSGLPGAGKTTLAHGLRDTYADTGAVVISLDEIETAIRGSSTGFSPQLWHSAR
jgi:Mrp family chromosome partitioning ATPase